MCTAKYCCNFDLSAMACAVDDADVKAVQIDPAWITQSTAMSPPSSMRLEVQGSAPSILNFGLTVEPKQSGGKRVDVEFALRMETTALAGILLVEGNVGTGSERWALSAAGGGVLSIVDSGTNAVGPVPLNTWVKVTVSIDPVMKTYGVSVGGGAVVTRNMGIAWVGTSFVRFGLTRTLDTTVVHYDDLRLTWN